MPRPPVDSRLQHIEKGILDINQKLDHQSNLSNDCGCSSNNQESKPKKNGESQNDK